MNIKEKEMLEAIVTSYNNEKLRLESLQGTIGDEEKKLVRVISDCDKAQEELASLDAELQTLRIKRLESEKELSAVNASLSESKKLLEDEMVNSETIKAGLNREFVELSKKVTGEKEELNAIQADKDIAIGIHNSAIEGAKDEFASLKEQVRKLKQESKDIQAEQEASMAEWEKKVSPISKQKDELDKEVEKLKVKISALNSEVLSLADQQLVEQQKVEVLRAGKQKAEAELKLLEDDIEGIRTSKLALEQKELVLRAKADQLHINYDEV